jgi:hypothetical protein
MAKSMILSFWRLHFSFAVLTIIVTILPLFIIVTPGFSMSFKGKFGHEMDLKNTLESLDGKNFDELIKKISKAIDQDLPTEIRKTVSRPVGIKNHRYFGHWGFEGNIPFNREPYKTYLSQFPKQDVVRVWQNTINRLTNEAVKHTGLPPRQAKALVGIIYNTHLLGDWKPDPKTNRILTPLQDPKLIKQDIVKNLHRLFGNNSNFAKLIEADLVAIKTRNPQLYADEVLQILRKYPIGKQMYQIYGKPLSRHGIKYVAIADSSVFNVIEKPTFYRLVKPVERFSDYDDMAKAMLKKNPYHNIQVRPGVLTNTGKLIVGLSEGVAGGVAVFATEAGMSGYHYLKGNILKPEFERQIQGAAIKGTTVAGASAVAVFLIPNPAGIIIIGVAAATYIATDAALQTWHKYQDGKYLNRRDLKAFGIEMDSILDIPNDSALTIFDHGSPLNASEWENDPF